MKKNYNYTRSKLFLPEYGRHIHEMVESLLTIEDRHERSRQAKAVIAVMGNLNPLLRDTADFTHKLWDHLFIMSDFQLDVDSPYPRPSRVDLTVTPQRLTYSQQRITHKHYGKYVSAMIRKLASDGGEGIGPTVENIARFMRAKSFEYNQEHPNNEVIINDIKQMSDGAISINEDAIISARPEYKQRYGNYQSKSQQRSGGRPTQRSRSNSSARPYQNSYQANRQGQHQGYAKNSRQFNTSK
jgi:hypothetical protein